MIHVCSLARLHATVAENRREPHRHADEDVHEVRRPESIAAEHHLLLDMDDIVVEIDGYHAPAEQHLTELIALRARLGPRSPAGGALLCRHQPLDCRRLRHRLRAQPASRRSRDRAQRSAAPRRRATPNARIVSLADRVLGRDGRMVRAIEAIGRGTDATEGHPFRLELE